MPPPADSPRSSAANLRSRTTESARTRPALGAILPILLSVVAACGGDDLLLPSAGEPARIEVWTGNEQADTVGRPLPDSLVVRVTDPQERPVEGIEVVFVAPAGAVLAPNDTVLTGPDGTAAVHYTLPNVSGPQTVEARAKPVVPTQALTAVFSVRADPEAAAALVMPPDGGNEQEAEVLTPLGDSLAVQAVDRFGNGVPGVEVVWQASDGAVSPGSVLTGADGRAATLRTLGARPGTYLTTAIAPALENSEIAFEATGIAPPSPQLVLVTQPSASAAAGVAFARQPVLQLQNAVGAPLPRADVPVTVQIAEGTGSLGGQTTARSNAEGRVTFTNLSIRGSPGDRSLLFAARDFTPATSEVIDVNPGPPNAGQSSASVSDGTAGTPTSIAIRVRDEFGTEIEGAADAIRVRVDGANSGEATVTEEGDGSYSAVYTPTHTGTDQLRVEVDGEPVDGSPLSSAVGPGPAAASATTADVLKVGSFFFQVTIVVTTRDAQGNPRGRGGERVQVRLEGGDALRDARDNGDGTYSDQFLTILSNPTIIITLNGVEISGSPFRP